MRNESVALHQEKITHQTEKPKENIILIKTNKNAFVIVFFLHNFSSFFESIRSNNILSILLPSKPLLFFHEWEKTDARVYISHHHFITEYSTLFVG